MKEYAEKFYKSKTWQRCREGYLKSKGGLCERCIASGIYRPGVIVHHKNYVTPETIRDPEVAIDWNNLELLCRDCHNAEHFRTRTRYKTDELGRITGIDTPP